MYVFSRLMVSKEGGCRLPGWRADCRCELTRRMLWASPWGDTSSYPFLLRQNSNCFPCAALLIPWSVPMLYCLLPLLSSLLSEVWSLFPSHLHLGDHSSSSKACLHAMFHISSPPCLPIPSTYLIMSTFVSVLDYKLLSLITTLGRLYRSN